MKLNFTDETQMFLAMILITVIVNVFFARSIHFISIFGT